MWENYKTFTDGSNFWRDQYLLPRWAANNMAVVYRGQTHNGYTLERSPERRVRRIQQVIKAVAELHKLGVVHGERVTEPENIGFGDGNIQLLDFEYSFRPKPGAAYGKDSFAIGTPLPPELIGDNKTTTEPFKVDSWHLGQLIYFILMDGCPIFRLGFWSRDDDIRKTYMQSLADLECGRDERMNKLPAEIKNAFAPVIEKLLVGDPRLRLSVQDLERSV
ncbi:hypothetical protein PLIIFM63780_010584 [Purpureocillium lilacinum]|nr:hypothetical protein PLIIFM63780_010584 [Purpureocillium lilacinum]